MTLEEGFYQYLLSLPVIVAFVLAWYGGQALWSGPARLRGLLTVAVAAMLIANVMIWGEPVRRF